jgi:glycosyltransferase involved in cell wall biosynthesis
VGDDGSSGATAAVAKAEGALVCRLPFNLGVGGAMRARYRYALQHGFTTAVQLDADGQHDPAYLEVMLGALEHADVAMGRASPAREPTRSGPRRCAMKLLAGCSLGSRTAA